MKWAYHIKHKIKAAGVLALIITIILVNNLTEEKKYKNLNSSISSIYEDRLLPATYIYKLSNHLYQKQLAHEHAVDYTPKQLSQQDQAHDAAIATLIDDYETTFLTAEEKQYWTVFKDNLNIYNALCATNEVSNKTLSNTLGNTINSLNNLSALQVGVGKDLQKNSKAILGSTVSTTQLENVLITILGLIAIVLFSISEQRIFRKEQNAKLN